MALFVWTGSGLFPAGPNNWNGQPLAVPPAQTYFTPSPANNPVLVPAENWNSILGQIAANLANVQPGSLVVITAGLVTITIPTNCSQILVDISGGGGGGGGGAGGMGGISGQMYVGGGGGAGAQRKMAILQVTAGAQYDVQVGVGGTGGTGGAGSTSGVQPNPGTVGGDGVPSIIVPHGLTNKLIDARGGQGGSGGGVNQFSTAAGSIVWVPGGGGPAGSVRGGLGNTALTSSSVNPAPAMRECDGGASVASFVTGTPATSYAGLSSDFFPGGVLGAAGATSGGTYPGGGGGGSGGGGGYGQGGNGGAGGAGNSGGLAVGGANGTTVPNSGSGGGGGGAGGNGSTQGGNGGNGANGGAGLCIIYFLPNGG